MKFSRRTFLSAAAGSTLLTLPGYVKAENDEKTVVLDTIKNNRNWLRLVKTPSDEYEIHAGNAAKVCAVLRNALGVRWYRNDGNLPDGERQASWVKADTGQNKEGIWILHGKIEDPRGGSWQVTTEVKKDEEGFRLINTFVRTGKPLAASLRIHTEFSARPSSAFTLIPGAVYNGNRADAVVPRGYCPLLTNHEVLSRESRKSRRVIADIPRQDASTWWTVHLLGYQSASANVSVFDVKEQSGIHIGYARTEKNRVLGIIHTADPDTDFHRLTVENPCVRERRFRNCAWVTSPDRPYTFQNGEEAVIELRLNPVTATDVPSFVSTWTAERQLRRAGLAPGQTGKSAGTPEVMPRSYASQLAIDWNDKNLWNEEGFYRTIHKNETHPRELILGWGSGTMTMLTMFLLGSEQVKKRIRTMTRFILDNAQAPGGLFYGVRMKDGKWITKDTSLDSFWAMNALTPRRTTDTVFYGMSLSDALKKENGQGDTALAHRLDISLQRACAALIRVWKKEGNIPFLLNPHTEKTVWAGGFGGAKAIGCLVEAHKRWKTPGYLQTATEIAQRYVTLGLQKGETWGGPSDVMQGTADNESLTALAEGLTLLYSVTKNLKHLQWAGQAADLLATWMLDEPIYFPKDSVLGQNNIQPFGALIASTQNAWGTPGLCVNSGKFLLDLYEYTGQDRYADMLSDIVRVPLQMMVRPGQKWGDLEPGQMTECASFNDVPGEFGHAYLGNATWPVNSMLLGEIDLPSIYIDGKKSWSFDHLKASFNDNGNIVVENPTDFDAMARLKWRNGAAVHLQIKPKETIVYEIK